MAKPFFLGACSKLKGEMVVTGGETVVTGGETVVAPSASEETVVVLLKRRLAVDL